MQEIFLLFLKWSLLLFTVNLTSSLLHEYLIQLTGAAFALFMLIKLLPRFLEKPFLGLIFSLLVISIAGVAATGLLKYGICPWQPNVAVCLPNSLSAQSFDFVAFPALIVVPWGAMTISRFFRK